MDDPNIYTSEALQTDEGKRKELLDAYHQHIANFERIEIISHTDNKDAPLDPKELPLFTYGFISEIKECMASWQMKKETTFEDKTYRSFSATSTNADGDSKLTFIEVQLIFQRPEDVLPIEASVTETKPDDNGALHERHFTAKLGNESTASLTYVEYPYKQVQAGHPLSNTMGNVVLGRKMLQSLARAL